MPTVSAAKRRAAVGFVGRELTSAGRIERSRASLRRGTVVVSAEDASMTRSAISYLGGAIRSGASGPAFLPTEPLWSEVSCALSLVSRRWFSLAAATPMLGRPKKRADGEHQAREGTQGGARRRDNVQAERFSGSLYRDTLAGRPFRERWDRAIARTSALPLAGRPIPRLASTSTNIDTLDEVTPTASSEAAGGPHGAARPRSQPPRRKTRPTEPPLDIRSLPALCVLGRPNVGKSTLYNRLVGRREAVVYNTPDGHVTRDYREGHGTLAGLHFRVMDTSGMEPLAQDGTVLARTLQLTAGVVRRADAVLFLLDGRQGVTPGDEEALTWLRKTKRQETPVILAVNKAESGGFSAEQRVSSTVSEAYALGLGEPLELSAETGAGMAGLFLALEPHLRRTEGAAEAGDAPEPEQLESVIRREQSGADPAAWSDAVEPEAQAEAQTEARPRYGEDAEIQGLPGHVPVAIIGVPNVGKSTMTNLLLGYDRSLVGPEPGLTRDEVRGSFERWGTRWDLVDTAGWLDRKRHPAIDKMFGEGTGGRLATVSAIKSEKAVEQSAVAVLVLDALSLRERVGRMSQLERLLVHEIEDEGRALVIAINKADLLTAHERRAAPLSIRDQIRQEAKALTGVEVVLTSGLEGRGVGSLLSAIKRTYRRWNTRATTGELNRWLSDLKAKHDHQGGIGRVTSRVKYITQVSTRPPTFVCTTGGAGALPNAADERGFERHLREHLGIEGVPVRVLFRRRRNPNDPRSERREEAQSESMKQRAKRAVVYGKRRK